jgi:hypothetical protein
MKVPPGKKIFPAGLSQTNLSQQTDKSRKNHG